MTPTVQPTAARKSPRRAASPETNNFSLPGQQNAGKPTEAVLRQQVLTDVHSPDEYSASFVRNLDAWYAAFNVKPGDKLYLAPSDRVRVW